MSYLYSNINEFWTSDDDVVDEEEEESETETETEDEEEEEEEAEEEEEEEEVENDGEKEVVEKIEDKIEKKQEQQQEGKQQEDTQTKGKSPQKKQKGTVGEKKKQVESSEKREDTTEETDRLIGIACSNIKEGFKFNLKEFINNNRTENSDSFSVSHILQNCDINDLIYNDSLLTFYDHGTEIQTVDISKEELCLNENFYLKHSNSFNYVNPPSTYDLKTEESKIMIPIKDKNEQEETHQIKKDKKENMEQSLEEEWDKRVKEEREGKEESDRKVKNEKEMEKEMEREMKELQKENERNKDVLINKQEENETEGNKNVLKKELNEEEEKPRVKYIRKKWVIEDNHSDVSNFSKDDLLLNYNFELDAFQKRSILHLNNLKHVFVAAHTSAGKTLIAEHAIALSIKLQKKAIYTSPIKALSNQKYNEFKNIFKSVGIITGDIKININASCLIMTTEILRNLLYINDNIISNIHCVIFDEVHYVNDEDRGFIWEETIIMLPDYVQILLLSATVPNYLEFADWVGFTKKKEIVAIATKHRPVPLLHYICAFDSMYLVMDENNKFYTSAFKELYIKLREKHEKKKGKALVAAAGGKNLAYNKKNKKNMNKESGMGTGAGTGVKAKGGEKGSGGQGVKGLANTAQANTEGRASVGKGENGCYTNISKSESFESNTGSIYDQNIYESNEAIGEEQEQPKENTSHLKIPPKKLRNHFMEANVKTEIQKLQMLIRKLEQDNKLPVVLFCFSRSKCEMYGRYMPNLNFLTSGEKSRVHIFIKESLSKLSAHDRELNQIKGLTAILERGVGIHHSGLLPILKEIVEILFSKGLIKILFATETFAMGINMPTKSVVFTSIYKHDHSKKRLLTSSEYTQMSGRAGRRSSDKFGYVYIFCCSNIPDQMQVTEMLTQKAVSLKSKFKITFNMILKLLINKQINLEQMMFSSFLESCRALQIPLFKRDLIRKKKMLQNIEDVDCLYIEECHTPPIHNYVDIDKKLKYVGLFLHQCLWLLKKSNAFVIGRVMLLNNIRILHSSVYAIYLGEDKKGGSQRATNTDLLKNSIFSTASNTGNLEKPESSFLFLVILPNFMTYDEMMAQINSKAEENIANKGSDGSKKENLLSEKVNMYENHINVFSKKQQQDKKRILHHAHFDTNMNRKYFVVCGDIGMSNISLITNTVIKVPNVNPASLANNMKGLLLYAMEFDRFLESANFQPVMINKWMKKMPGPAYNALLKQTDYLKMLKQNKCYNCNLIEKHYELIEKKTECVNDIENIERNINVRSLYLYEDMEAKIQVLRHFDFIDDEHNLTLKGKVASYVTLNDEITLTQIIFENLLNNLQPEEIAAVLSCFVAPEKKMDESPDITVNLQNVKVALTEIHGKFEDYYNKIRLKISSEEHWRICNFKVMFMAYQWAKGVSFAELLEQTQIEEGLIVRTILRLDELCRRVKVAFLYLGNVELAELVEKTSSMIRRDIIFTTSLYLQ